MSALKDITGQRFGRLVVVRRVGSSLDRRATWQCRCDCDGKTITIVGKNLRNGNTKSCGCLKLELFLARATTHGMSESPEFSVWQDIQKRCLPNYREAKYYADRGITVCDRWLESFENFYADMGPRPSSKHSIDRIDNNGNYEPMNCQWSTDTEQSRNRRAQYNSKSGIRGVWLYPNSDRFVVYIKANNKNYYLGSSRDKNEARQIRILGEQKYWGKQVTPSSPVLS